MIDFDGIDIARCSTCLEITVGRCRQCEQAVCYECTVANDHACFLGAKSGKED